jgi:hypothetical protein
MKPNINKIVEKKNMNSQRWPLVNTSSYFQLTSYQCQHCSYYWLEINNSKNEKLDINVLRKHKVELDVFKDVLFNALCLPFLMFQVLASLGFTSHSMDRSSCVGIVCHMCFFYLGRIGRFRGRWRKLVLLNNKVLM